MENTLLLSDDHVLFYNNGLMGVKAVLYYFVLVISNYEYLKRELCSL